MGRTEICVEGEQDMALPDNPLTRSEQYLAKIAGQDTALPDAPLTRVEQYLDYIAKNRYDEKTYEKIAEVTYDGETPFTSISEDETGAPFQLTAAVLIAKIGNASANGTVTFRFVYGSNNPVYRAYQSYSANKAGYISFAKASRDHGMWFGYHTSFTNNGYGTINTQSDAFENHPASTNPFIESIDTTSAWTPPAGTTITLYGVRA